MKLIFPKFTFDIIEKKSLKYNTINNFSGMYFTIISIIQGVTFGILISNTFEYIEKLSPTIWIKYIPYSVISCFVIILVTYQYLIFISIFRRSPTVIDVFIPFTLGITQAIPTYFLTNPEVWWLFMAVFCVAGFFAFLNTFINCIPGMFPGMYNAYEKTRRILRDFLILTALNFILYLIGWLISCYGTLSFLFKSILFLIISVLGALIFHRGNQFMEKLLDDYGLIEGDKKTL